MLGVCRLRGDACAVETDDAGDGTFEIRVTIVTGFLGDVRAIDLGRRDLTEMLSDRSPRIGRFEICLVFGLAYGCWEVEPADTRGITCGP